MPPIGVSLCQLVGRLGPALLLPEVYHPPSHEWRIVMKLNGIIMMPEASRFGSIKQVWQLTGIIFLIFSVAELSVFTDWFIL